MTDFYCPNRIIIGRLPKRKTGKYRKYQKTPNAQILETNEEFIEPTHQVIAHVIEEHIEGYAGISLTNIL